ncbi:PAS domain S-box protein [Tychonema sp. LEGE 07199]|uniref:PAS domain S-box protein n=1 Tax=unclassified Tychonema TaxID=2642144 RepID=UPI00188040D3|nr:MULTISPECIES: PAS domain S-box protein [unclassified Tychonema]MBE9120078.1 PAS domain S-box protein [Tychonema sp. LEGE 07199]MBE9132840.1 PAS domain S-box protein [Tychonema sp. LEGE 07196]
MTDSVHIKKRNNKLLHFLQMRLREITAAEVNRKQKTKSRMLYKKNISLETIARSSQFSVLIVVLLLLNWWLVASGASGLHDRPIALAFLAITNIVLLAAAAEWNASAAKKNDRQSGKTDEGDRFFSLSPDMLCVIGFDGYFKRINPAAEKILGYSPAEIVGQLFIEFVHPDDRQATLKEAESIAAGNSSVGFENRWRCRNGSYKWVAWTVSPFCEEELMYAIGRDVTDRKQAQESLQHSNSILRSVIESTPDLIFVKDLEGRYAIANSALAQFLEKPIETIIGKDDSALFPPEIAAQVIEGDRRVTATGECFTYEEDIPKNGVVRTFLTAKYPWRDSEGKFIGVVGISRDISDRKEIEAALLEKNILLESVIESTGDSIFVKDIHGRHLLVNSQAAAIIGLPKSEIIGKKDAELFPPDIADMQEENDRRVRQSGIEETIEEAGKDSDGNIRTFLSTKSPLRDRLGNIIGVVGVARDISDRKQAEQALQESEERYRCLIEATSQIVWDTTAVGEVIGEQTGLSAFTGATYHELKGWGWLDRVHPDDREYTATMWSDAVANCILFAIEHRLLRHDGEYRYMSVRGVPLLNADGSVRQWVGIHSDITESKIIEQEIQQQKEFLGSIYDGVDYSIFVVDVSEDGEFRYVGWNLAAELVGGISSEFGRGKTPQELFDPITAGMFRQNFIECLEKGSSIVREYPASFDGIEVWFMTNLTPLRDASGKIYRVVGSSSDITERKKAEIQLREQEEFLNSIYNGSNQAIFVIDVGAEGEFRYAGWNAAAEASTGILSADFKGKTPEEIFPPPIAAIFRQSYVDCLRAGSSIAYETSAEIEGAERWYIVTLTPLRDASGSIYRIIGNSIDITDRKQAEAALQESQHFVERIANATPNILYVYDDIEHRNVYSNRELAETLGYSLEEVATMGRNLLPTIIHPEDFAQFPEYLQQLKNTPDDEVVEYEYRVRDKQNNWHWFVSREIIFSRTESGKIKQRLGAATDVTERKKAEQSLAEQLKISLFTADIGIALTQNQSLPATLQKCTDAVVRHLDAAFARIWTLNEQGDVLELQASGGMYTHIDGAHSRIAVGQFKIGLIARERKPHITNFVETDPLVSDKEWASREGMVAFAGYPLIVDNQLLGVIVMFARHELQESILIALASSVDSIALGIKRKQTEMALAAQKQTMRTIIDNAPIWVWMANPSGRMLLVNKTFCEDVAVSEDQFLAASHYSEVLGLEASANCMASDAQAWSQDTPCYSEELLQLADGDYHQLETIKTQVKDDYGRAIGLIGLGLDVTQQKESQRQLQESEARFRKLAEQEILLNQLASNIRKSLNLDTILATTVQQIRDLLRLDSCVFVWYNAEVYPPVWEVEYEARNANLSSLLGVFSISATGSHAERIAKLEIIRIDDFETVTDPVEREYFTNIGFHSLLNIPVQTSAGKIGLIGCTSSSGVRYWSDEEVELLVAVGNQLAIAINQAELYTQSVDSARIAQEQTAQLETTLCELKLAQTQLVQAEKMSSLGQMVAGIAHEINNPVSFIFGNLTYTEEYTENLIKLLQMYRDEHPEPSPNLQEEIERLELDFLLDDLPKMLSSMQVGATRIRDIVRSLRNFSRLDEAEMKDVNIHDGIDSTLMILEHRLKAQQDRAAIKVIKEYGELPLVECYAGLLNQVFMNIIANAIDALQYPPENPGIIRIRTGVEGNCAAIKIADNGSGIADQVKQRIFDPFYTTKPIGSGTGMGLAISHSIIVEKHKGKINCFSAVGKGTEFAIEIPIKRIEH